VKARNHYTYIEPSQILSEASERVSRNFKTDPAAKRIDANTMSRKFSASLITSGFYNNHEYLAHAG